MVGLTKLLEYESEAENSDNFNWNFLFRFYSSSRNLVNPTPSFSLRAIRACSNVRVMRAEITTAIPRFNHEMKI